MKPSKKLAVSFVFLMAAAWDFSIFLNSTHVLTINSGAAASCVRLVYSLEIITLGVAVVSKDRFCKGIFLLLCDILSLTTDSGRYRALLLSCFRARPLFNSRQPTIPSISLPGHNP